MTIPEIASLPVQQISAADSLLFLWVTIPHLKSGLSIIEAWGFTYKTVAFVWVKQTKKSGSLHWGMGHWTRSNAELCLLGTRGHPKRANAGVHSVIMSPVRKHSQKPQEARDRIVTLCGDVPRIELFAREQEVGWDAWGDEVTSSVTLVPGRFTT